MRVTWVNANYNPGAGYRQCGNCGALVPGSNMIQHENFHATFTNRTDGNMSKVLWCDPGNHAFKAGSPGSIHYQGSEVGDDGMTHSADVDACIQHNPFRAKPENIIRELNAEYPTTDPINDTGR